MLEHRNKGKRNEKSAQLLEQKTESTEALKILDQMLRYVKGRTRN